MALNKWTYDELDEVKNFLKTNPKKRTQDTVKHLKLKFGNKYREYTIRSLEHIIAKIDSNENIGVTANNRPDIEAKEYVIRLKEFIQNNKGKTIHCSSIKAEREIISIQDLHIPFWKLKMIEEVLNKVKGKNKTLVINGDFLDVYCVSSFRKNKHIPLMYEYKLGLEFLDKWKKCFKQIILTDGNHEKRVSSYFEDNVKSEVHFLIYKHIMELLASGIQFDDDGKIIGKKDFKNVVYVGGNESWWVKIGDCIFAHPSSFNRGMLNTGLNTSKYFENRGENFHAIVVAHTHFQGKGISPSGKLIIETGCMCEPLDYQISGRVTSLPQHLGYAHIFQDSQGRTDYNKSCAVYLGIEIPSKRGNI